MKTILSLGILMFFMAAQGFAMGTQPSSSPEVQNKEEGNVTQTAGTNTTVDTDATSEIDTGLGTSSATGAATTDTGIATSSTSNIGPSGTSANTSAPDAI